MSVNLGINGEVIVMNDVGVVVDPQTITAEEPGVAIPLQDPQATQKGIQKNMSEHTYLFPTLNKEVKPGETIELAGEYIDFKPEGA